MKILLSFLRWLAGPPRQRPASASPETCIDSNPRERQPLRHGFVFMRFQGDGDPPAGHWKACHPSTAVRFKAEVTCPRGHGMVLKGHSVSKTGVVRPSIVCPDPGCSFHEYALLENWSGGDLR